MVQFHQIAGRCSDGRIDTSQPTKAEQCHRNAKRLSEKGKPRQTRPRQLSLDIIICERGDFMLQATYICIHVRREVFVTNTNPNPKPGNPLLPHAPRMPENLSGRTSPGGISLCNLIITIVLRCREKSVSDSVNSASRLRVLFCDRFARRCMGVINGQTRHVNSRSAHIDGILGRLSLFGTN